MRIQLSLGLQRSLAWRRKCSQLDVELRRHVGTESAAWVNRINKVIQQPQEMFNSAMKPVRKLKPRADLRYDQEIASNLAARTMDTLVKEISARFKTFNSRFPRFEALHPFEKSVLNLAVGEANYQRILGNADKLRRRVVKVGKEYASKAKAAKTPAQAGVCSDEGTKAVHQVLTVHGKGALWELRHLARQMRQVPQIDLFVPTVQLACMLWRGSLVYS